MLSLSGKVSPEEYKKIVGDVPVYEIEVDGATPEFLSYKSRLQKFRFCIVRCLVKFELIME